MSSQYIIYYAKHARPELVGQKAYNLFLLNKSFRVPEFCVVTTNVYREFKKHNSMTQRMEDTLRPMLEEFLAKGTVAVRSSGTTEDMPGISFAGMYSTTLNVTTVDEGLAAILKTWRSSRSERVTKYCATRKVRCGDMAVILQQQLNPEVSGVMVTQSPFSVQEVLIECCTGLGEKLVSGRITPTRYRIRGEDMVEQKGAQLLSDRQIQELISVGKKIESVLKSAQDIEWAIANRQLYILQSRPVQVHTAAPRRKCTVWTNANVRETIPDPISPMGWSIFDGVFFPHIFTDVFRFPLSHERYYKFRPVELLSGRLYWNVNNTMAYAKPVGSILEFVRSGEAIDPQFAAAFDAVDERSLPHVLSPFRMRLFTIVASCRLLYFFMLGFFRYRSMAQKIRKAYAAFDRIKDDLTPVHDLGIGLQNIEAWFELILKKFTRRYFGGLGLSVFYLALLGIVLSLKTGKRGEMVARKTTVGILDKTGEMVLAMSQLSKMARKRVKEVTVQKLKNLYRTDKTFRHHFDTFMAEFGHRGPAEFDIASLNWREDHDLVYRLLETMQQTEEYSIDRAQLIRDMLARAKPFERFLLKTFIPRIEAFSPFREDGKHIYFKLGSKIKDQLLAMAGVMRERGFLKCERDIFFLTLPDIAGIHDNLFREDEILKRVQVRKQQWDAYRRAEAADIIYETGERITTSVSASARLSGESLSFGRVTAHARLIRDFAESHRLAKGDILVTHHTDPGWTPLFTICSGVIVEVGGLICHAAMVARELGVPAVVIQGATSLISDHALVELDADEGIVKLLEKAEGTRQTAK